MKTYRPILSIAAILAATALPAWAQASISIDRMSPSNGCGGPPPVAPRHIYSQVVPAGGCDVAGPGPQLQVAGGAFGLVPGDNVDALSANLQWDPNSNFVYIFSGDRPSMGQPMTPYRNQFNRNQAAADLFTTAALPTATPGAVMAGLCGAPAMIAPPAPRILNQVDFNLAPTVGPGVFWMGNIDNIDAVELDDLDPTNDGIHDVGIYFSLDAASPSMITSPADIYYAPPGGAFGLFSLPAQIGLAGANNLDALVLWDRMAAGWVDPGSDFALFSLAPGSPALNGPDGVAGTADDFSAADLFVSDFTGVFCLYTRANQLGLLPQDNVDGLDVAIWGGGD
jgi:hypothetical protein